MLNTMIRDLNNINKRTFEGSETYSELNRGLESFALSVQQVIKTKYPEVFSMTEDEYNLIAKEVEEWLLEKETIDLIEEYRIEALTMIAIEAVTSMYKLNEDINILETLKERVILLMEIEDDKKI